MLLLELFIFTQVTYISLKVRRQKKMTVLFHLLANYKSLNRLIDSFNQRQKIGYLGESKLFLSI